MNTLRSLLFTLLISISTTLYAAFCYTETPICKLIFILLTIGLLGIHDLFRAKAENKSAKTVVVKYLICIIASYLICGLNNYNISSVIGSVITTLFTSVMIGNTDATMNRMANDNMTRAVIHSHNNSSRRGK